MKHSKFILLLVLSVFCSASFAGKPLKDSIMHTPNGVLKVTVDFFENMDIFENKNIYDITITDTTKHRSLPIPGPSGPFAYNLKEFVQSCYKNTIPLVKELYPNICKWIHEKKIWSCTIFVTCNDKELERKFIRLYTQDESLVNPIIQEIMQNNNFENLMDKAIKQVYEEVKPSIINDQLPDLIKNEMKKGDYSFNYILGIRLIPQKLSEF